MEWECSITLYLSGIILRWGMYWLLLQSRKIRHVAFHAVALLMKVRIIHLAVGEAFMHASI